MRTMPTTSRPSLASRTEVMYSPCSTSTKDSRMTRTLASFRTTALVAALMAGAVLSTPALAVAPAAAATGEQAKLKLDHLADAFYLARAKFDPLLYATANGDSRYDDQIGMRIAPKVRAQQFALYHKMQQQLHAIPRAQLADKAQLNYDLLAFELDSALDMEKFPEHLLPINQMDNVPSTLANYADGTGSQPLTTPKQYDAYLSRINQLPAWIDQAIANMKEGIRTGVVLPKAITVSMLPQFQNLRSKSAETSIFYSPITRLPAQFSDADKQRLTAAYRASVTKLEPALDRLAHFLETDYLAASRDSTGLGALPNGQAWYLAAIKDNTSLALPPAQIHELGLKEVARIQAQLAALGPKLGYNGPADQLPQWVAAQDKFKPFKTDEEVLNAYRDIYAKVSAQLPTYFSLLPKAKLSLQLEPELTRATASDHYTPLAADGSHPGVFWPVVNDATKYSDVSMVSLFLHEGVPGHHLHAALLKELDLPDFRKFNTENPETASYTEGWALYCETLGKEFGLYDNQAFDYTMKTLGYSHGRAQNQIERYMVMPAQALAYKIGAMKILELRARAQQALGPKFSYQKFHEVVTGDGTLSLAILEAQVDRWIASAK